MEECLAQAHEADGEEREDHGDQGLAPVQVDLQEAAKEHGQHHRDDHAQNGPQDHMRAALPERELGLLPLAIGLRDEDEGEGNGNRQDLGDQAVTHPLGEESIGRPRRLDHGAVAGGLRGGLLVLGLRGRRGPAGSERGEGRLVPHRFRRHGGVLRGEGVPGQPGHAREPREGGLVPGRICRTLNGGAIFLGWCGQHLQRLGEHPPLDHGPEAEDTQGHAGRHIKPAGRGCEVGEVVLRDQAGDEPQRGADAHEAPLAEGVLALADALPWAPRGKD
mmetsp:Transcript_101685/g.283081  ORF Transcript_101685/g.283081 Transcript_101685/m.283081 type:complete len:276 (+) Transcript_101685:183-1010(+)